MDGPEWAENMENVHKFPELGDRYTGSGDFVGEAQISRKRLINKLNYINFQNKTLLVQFRHVKYDRIVSCPVKPLPCSDDVLECVWDGRNGGQPDLTAFRFLQLLVPNGHQVLIVRPEVLRIDETGIEVILPELCVLVTSRKTQRRDCKGIQAQLVQNSTMFYGVLLDFSAISLHVELTALPPQTFQWIDNESCITLILSNSNEMLYAGECRIVKHSSGLKTRRFIVEPTGREIQRHKPKEFRSTRQELVPSPNVIFKHPFTEEIINLKALDVAGSGFSVEENEDSAVLLPGMVIPELKLDFAGTFKIECKVQVVYSLLLDEGRDGNRLKCGLAMLDLDIQDHTRLLGLLQQAMDKNSYLCNPVDLDELWNFFFESGFIYPQKYAFLESNKDQIKATYEKLYTQNPSIAKHFIYQDKGRILGHMAMLRFYESSWLIHHHAANGSASNRAGLVVLDQISRFSNSSRSLYSIHMDYLICYFRPENKFPSRVFGGVARYIKNPKGCSLDEFAYLHFRNSVSKPTMLPKPWTLSPTDVDDLVKLEAFYENESGGIMIDALDLQPDMVGCEDLSEEFRRLGFQREKKLFSLKKENRLKAVFMACISNLGLNLSDLTNCLKVFVLDPETLPRDTLYQAVSELSVYFERAEVPLMIYPVSYADSVSVPYEKVYTLWVLNTQFGDPYYKYLNRLLRSVHS